jgi:hypothetical protein
MEEMRNEYKIWVGKPDWNRPLGGSIKLSRKY